MPHRRGHKKDVEIDSAATIKGHWKLSCFLGLQWRQHSQFLNSDSFIKQQFFQKELTKRRATAINNE
jgi:hypothetical protein